MTELLNLTQKENWTMENAARIALELRQKDNSEFRSLLKVFIEEEIPSYMITTHLVSIATRYFRDKLET